MTGQILKRTLIKCYVDMFFNVLRVCKLNIEYIKISVEELTCSDPFHTPVGKLIWGVRRKLHFKAKKDYQIKIPPLFFPL